MHRRGIGFGGKGMIIGIGTDIIEIGRIKAAVERESFLTKYFSEKENEYFNDRKYKDETIACNFAAKEAFAKALGTGLRGFALKEVEVLRDDLGRPYIELSGDAQKVARSKSIRKIHVSLSHSREYAIAYVVAEK